MAGIGESPAECAGVFDLSEIGGQDYAGSINVGMTDLVATLRWARDNIANFGGDPGILRLPTGIEPPRRHHANLDLVDHRVPAETPSLSLSTPSSRLRNGFITGHLTPFFEKNA